MHKLLLIHKITFRERIPAYTTTISLDLQILWIKLFIATLINALFSIFTIVSVYLNWWLLFNQISLPDDTGQLQF